jgi:hypothetical protein
VLQERFRNRKEEEGHSAKGLRGLTARDAITKIEQSWSNRSAASWQRSCFLMPMAGMFDWAHCGLTVPPLSFSFGIMDEFFAASMSRSCANASRPSAAKEWR